MVLEPKPERGGGGVARGLADFSVSIVIIALSHFVTCKLWKNGSKNSFLYL